MRRFLIGLLGGLTREEAEARVRREREAGNERFRACVERARRGAPEYGVPPLERYQAYGLLTGVE